MIKNIYLYSLIGLLVFAKAMAQDLNVKAYTDNTVIGLNQQFILHVEISGEDLNALSDPEFPKLDQFATLVNGDKTESMQFINGKMLVSKKISYVYMATTVGKFHIDPVIVKAGSKVYQTEPILIEIQKTSTPKIEIPMCVNAKDRDKKDVWKFVKYFVGSWAGESIGNAGEGKGHRTYEFIMKKNYLHYRNTTRFDPHAMNPKGEMHEEWGFFSYDEGRDRIILRQFNIEGFVNTFVLDSLSTDHQTIILTTESSENVPAGIKARYTITIKSENEFEEIFDLGFPGREMTCYMTNTWERIEEE